MALQLLLPVVVTVCGLTQAVLAEDASEQPRSQIGRLRYELLSETRYHPAVSPQRNGTEYIPVNIVFLLAQPPALDTQRHLLQLEATVCMSWRDPRLTWDPAQYGGLDEISFKRSEVWWPHFAHWNRRGPLHALPSTGMIFARSDGKMRHCYSSTSRATCVVDLSEFPYDQHECKLSYFGLHDITIASHVVRGPAEDTNAEYEVVNTTCGVTPKMYICYLTFVLRRRNLLHLYTILVPTTVVLVLSLLVFWLPPGSERKVTLASICFLLTILLLHRASDVVGEVNPVPKLIKIIAAMSLIDSIVIFCAVLNISMANRSATPTCRPPSFVVKLSEGLLGRLLCICSPPFSEQEARGETVGFEVHKECYLAAQILDRLFFVVILTTLIAIVC